jgi:hypothetical protein
MRQLLNIGLRILRYLYGTRNIGVHIQKSSSLLLARFSNADWAGNVVIFLWCQFDYVECSQTAYHLSI